MKLKKTITTALFILIIYSVVYSQDFYNLHFLQKCDSVPTGLCHWDLSWGGKKSVTPLFENNLSCLLMEAQDENSVTFVEQSAMNKNPEQTQILSISARVKCEEVMGKGAGLNIGIYDYSGQLIASKDMGGFYSVDWIRGTKKWSTYKLSIVCPKQTASIKIGMILYGKGKVWFTNFITQLTPIENRIPSKLAYKYITSVCDTIGENSLVKDSINIQQLKEEALKIAGPAKNYSECFLAIHFLLESLRPFGDHHSFFMTAAEVKNWKNEGSQVSKIEFPQYKIIEGCGYLLVPAFHGGNPKQMKAYADSMQYAIQYLNNQSIKGWIIDNRQNTGGNMEPMIAGLGPLFNSVKLGALVDVKGQSHAWYYQDGKYYGDGFKGWSVSHPVQLPQSLPIAVLTSGQTGSSGEVVTISFIGNLLTQSFGQPTWGLTTGNGSFELKDGSQIFLASTIMADRNGNPYTQSINPDHFIEDNTATPQDEVLDAAIEWLKK